MMTRVPRLPDVGVLAMVPDRFDEPWQPRHQILTRLSCYFHVVWVDPAPEWREMLRYPRARPSRASSLNGANAFVVYRAPKWLPRFHKPARLARLVERLRLEQARRVLRRRDCRRIVLSIWRPELDASLALVPHDLAAYHLDDEYSFSSIERPLDPRELRLLESVDVVSMHSPGLLRRKGHINPRTAFIPNGVDYEAFASPAREPADLVRIPRPRLGYAGYLKSQLDWVLLHELISSHREWQFVFVGAQRPHAAVGPIVAALSREPNVYFLGAKKTHELAAYAQHFDVCLMPYGIDAYTNCIYPLKLHEYLASGRPVVGSRIVSLEAFADVVALAATAAEWSHAIDVALAPAAQAESSRAARQAVARRHDWTVIVEQMARLIAGGLGEESAARLEQAIGQPSCAR
jgi:glycosyltransferase involved in cell wall biosynthesis